MATVEDRLTSVVNATYSRESAATHAGAEREEVAQVLQYMNALLRELLPPRSQYLSGREHSRVVLPLEAIGRQKEELNEETRERFQFTEREQAIMQCLAKGWTNKEIGGALKLTLPTVKEHIQHIMAKTNTTTRAGILVRVFRM